MSLNDEMKAAVKKLRDLNSRWDLLQYDEEHSQVLGPPCTSSELDEVARKLGTKLPPSYAAFLALHNGWTDFMANAGLLSVQERDQPWVEERIGEFREQLIEFFDESILDDAFILGLAEDGRDLVYLDTSSGRADGEMDVVHFDMIDGEIGRYPDLVSLLNEEIEVVGRIVKEI